MLSLEQIRVFFETLSVAEFTAMFWKGLGNTVKIAVIGLIIGIVIGTLLAIVKVAPKYKLSMRILDKIASVYVAIFRGTPMVVQLLVAYFLFLPFLLPGIMSMFNINPTENSIDFAFYVGTVVFGMNSGAYVSEIMRGGLNSVDSGQMEAGRALGLSYSTTMFKIVIPQAIKNILPTLGNEFITLIKETSVLSFIAVCDLYTAVKQIAQPGYAYEAGYLFMALIYIAIILFITALIKVMEHFLNKSDSKYGVTKSAKKS